MTIKSDSIHEDYLHAKSSENGVSTTETIFPKVKQFNSIIKPVKESVTMSPVSESAFSMEESMYRHDQEPEHIENEDSEPLSTGHLTSDEIPENGATDEPQIEHLGVDQFNENLKLSVTQGKLSVNTQSSAMENKESNPKPLAISPKRRPSKRSVLNSKGNSSSEPPSAQTNFSSPQYVGSSAARTDFFSPQSSSGDIDIQQRICNAVKKFNCTDSQVTLLKLVAQTPDDESEAVIQAHLKLHSKDLLDILSKIFNTLTERNKVGIHITEAHYIDRQSWDLLMDLAVACPRLPLMMYNRPINTFESKENKRIYRLITQLPRSQEVSLQGLSLDETTSLIKATWQPHVLRSVDPIISESIYKRTDGNPFFITSLVLALKDSGQWRISPVGDLTTPDAKFDFDRLVLGYDNQNIVLAQFDKLDRNFQLFLKIASVLGHKFSLDNVIYFITGLPDLNQHVNKHQYQTIVKSIATTDKYKFLVMEKPVVDEGSYFQFRSTLVQSCIYNMMVQNQRQQLHLLAARFLENRINDQNKHRFVVSILDHYMNTAESHQAKRIQYSETAAFFFFEKEDFSEAIKYYKQVLQLVQKPEGGYIDSISKHKIANFRRELGYSLMMMNEIDEAETNLRLSLELMDIKWPLPGLRFAFATQTQSKKRAEQDKRFFRDRPPLMIEDYTQSYVSRVGGISGYSLTNLPQTAKDKSKGEYSGEDMSMSLSALRVGASLSPAQEVIRITRDMILAGQQHALVSLAEVLLKKGDFKGHFYAILLGLNIGFEKGIENHMSKLYALGALAHRHQMKDNSELPIQYMEAAISFDLRTDIHISLNQVSSHAILLFLLGQFEACLTKVEIMYYLSGMAGDLNFRVVAQHFKCLALSHSKPQEMSLKTARALLSFSNQREIDYGSFWGSFHIIQNLLGQDSSKEEILSLIDNIEKHSETLPKALIHVFVAKECIKITVGICCDWVVDFHKSLDTLSHLVETVPFNEWMVYDGFSILIIGIFNGLRFKKFDDHSVALCTQLCRNINVCLKEMKGLGGLRETMRRIFKGLRVYPKNPDSAIKIWKAGIDDDSEDIYVQGMLCAMI